MVRLRVHVTTAAMFSMSPGSSDSPTPTTDSPLVASAREWVTAQYPYNREHLLRALEWLDRIAPGAPEAVRLATLTHDMERAFPGPDQPVHRTLIDPAYEQAHADRSARIVGGWLREQQADESLVLEVERLIRAHEIGGWDDADLVQAADSLSLLETNVGLFLGFVRSGRFSAADVGRKFDWSRDRIRIPHLKQVAGPLAAAAQEKLAALERDLGGNTLAHAERS
jgi:hypothetical protein